MAVNRIQAGGTNPTPDRPNTNIVAGNDITVTASDDVTNQVSKITISGSGSSAYGTPKSTTVVLSSAVTGAVVARWTPGYAGTISKLSAFAIVPVATTSKLATLTAANSGVSVSGGALAVTSTAAATLGTGIACSSISGLAAFTATQEITIVASAVTAFVEGQLCIDLFISHP